MAHSINLEKAILPAGGDSFSRFAAVQIKNITYVRDYCPEHKRDELIRQKEYHTDLGYWYLNGLHPRFSIIDAFLKDGQTDREIFNHFGPFFRHSRDIEQGREHAEARNALFGALKASQTEDDFLKILHPRLFTDLNPGDRTYRVTNVFKEKYEQKAFTTDDFFAERNQDIRRLILRAGASLKEVLSRLVLMAEDEEGKLYETKEDAQREQGIFPGMDRMRYLYVVCPSTGQEYLLQVPGTASTPKEARRWTFDLPTDAEFSKEA